MSCCAETRENLRQTFGKKELNLNDWKARSSYIWPGMKRRQPTALVCNSLHRRIYQCFFCGQELEIVNHHRLTEEDRDQVYTFQNRHNSLECDQL